jgi:hypothetical protein
MSAIFEYSGVLFSLFRTYLSQPTGAIGVKEAF